MTFIQQIQLGLESYFEAHRFIRRHRLWFYVALPGIINLVIFAITMVWGWHTSTDITDRIMAWFGLEVTTNTISVIRETLRIFILIVMRVMLFMVYISIYKYIVLILMSPVMALLSEKVESIISGNSYPFNFWQFLKDVLRGVLLAIRNLILEIIFTILLLLLAVVSVIGMISPLLIFLLASYFYGFSMIDYYHERLKIPSGKSSRIIAKYKFFAASNGAVFLGMLFIPVIGLLVAPSYAVVAATLGMYEIRRTGHEG